MHGWPYGSKGVRYLVTVCMALCMGCIGLGVAPAWAMGAMFSVTPVRIFLSPRDRAAPITLVNEGDKPVMLQAELLDWKQSPTGQDVLTPSDDVILSPPIIDLPPRGRQVVRLARVGPPPIDEQLTFRLMIREVPNVENPDRPVIQIPITLALSLPVFITPNHLQRAVTCEWVGSSTVTELRCLNQGKLYAQILSVTLKQADRVLAELEGINYLLPGSSKVMPVTFLQAPQPGPLELDIRFDTGGRQSMTLIWP
jgi:fimbrial chaperone protein